MGKRYRKSVTKASPAPHAVPHVVLLLGPHVAGVEAEVGCVLAAEKPKGVYIEGIATPAQLAFRHRDLRQNAERQIHHPHPSTSFVARMYLLAKQHNLEFDFMERHTDESAGKVRQFLNETKEASGRAAAAVQSGDVDAMVLHMRSQLEALQKAGNLREPMMTEFILQEARKRGKVVVFAGFAHSGLVKRLAEKGARVTVYTVSRTSLASNVELGPHLKTLSRENALKFMFDTLIWHYVSDRYGVGIEDKFRLPAALMPPQLRGIPVSEMEKFIRNTAGATPVAFRTQLLGLFERHGVKFPKRDDVEEELGKAVFPPFRKVKTFEPGKHFVKREVK